MDWTEIVALHSKEHLSDEQMDELYEELVCFADVSKVESKHIKKLFKLTQRILQYKGEQVTSLLSELDVIATTEIETTDLSSQLELAKAKIATLKKTIEKLQVDKVTVELKQKQDRIYDTDRDDSPNELSELDQQQELLNTISTKNKHIKKLLRDIETLEKESTESYGIIKELRTHLTDATQNIARLSAQHIESQQVIDEHGNMFNLYEAKIKVLEQDKLDIQAQIVDRDAEIKQFTAELEKRADLWQNVLRKKQSDFDALHLKYEELVQRFPGVDFELEQNQLRHLALCVKERDERIGELEAKLNELSAELINATAIINNLSAAQEQQLHDNPANSKCCDEIHAKHAQATKKLKKTQELLREAEDELVLKSRQAIEAMAALKLSQAGEDGLPEALKKNAELLRKVSSRDKQIRAMVMEINQAQDLGMENMMLRKQLGIPENETLSTTTYEASQRKLKKINERLALKLRASEEIRLQLKLDKNELKRNIHILSQKCDKKQKRSENAPTNRGAGDFAVQNVSDDDQYSSEVSSVIEMKYCEVCLRQYKSTAGTESDNICTHCDKTTKEINDQLTKAKNEIADLQANYENVIEENEGLRIGLHEILFNIRKHDATSNHTSTDSTALEKLLHALDARSISGWYHPAMRMQNELLASRERELALTSRMQFAEALLNQQPYTNAVSEMVDESPHDMTDHRVFETVFTSTTDLFDAHPDTETGHTKDDISRLLLDQNTQNILLQTEIDELKTEIAKLRVDTDQLAVTKDRNNELLSLFEQTDPDKQCYIENAIKELDATKVNAMCNENRIMFLNGDYDRLKTQLIEYKLRLSDVISFYRKELTREKSENTSLKRKLSETNGKIGKDTVLKSEYESVSDECEKLRLRLSAICGKVLDNNSNIDLATSGKLRPVAIIENAIYTDIITRDELKKLDERATKAERLANEMSLRIESLEELLKIAQEQARTKEDILSKVTNDEFNLRHLVVDLQSTNNEKHLIAKLTKDIHNLQENEEHLQRVSVSQQDEAGQLRADIERLESCVREMETANQREISNFAIKLKYTVAAYLTSSLQKMKDDYCQYLPLCHIVDYVELYSALVEHRNKIDQKSIEDDPQQTPPEVGDNPEADLVQDKIQLIKYHTKCSNLQLSIMSQQETIRKLTEELDDRKKKVAATEEHWKTVSMLFGSSEPPQQTEFSHKAVQVSIDYSDKRTSTDLEDITIDIVQIEANTIHSPPIGNIPKVAEPNQPPNVFLESQLKQAMILASTRSSLLLETENSLAESRGRIKALENLLEEKNELLRNELRKNTSNTTQNDAQTSSMSLQKIIFDKDATLTKYQDLLKSERQEHLRAFDESILEIKTIKAVISVQESSIKEQALVIEQLTDQLKAANAETVEMLNRTSRKLTVEESSPRLIADDSNLVEISDKYIEEMFLETSSTLDLETQKIQCDELGSRNAELENEVKKLNGQLREASNRERMWQKSLTEKSQEIEKLNERLIQDVPLNITSEREMQQFKDMLDDKDQHIQDLTDTLTHFHEDQQKYISDTSLMSADQLTQMSSDLSRVDATNRVLNTQIDALKRQIASLTLRENQARDLIKTLKTQLIRRPVISVKTERAVSRDEQSLRKIKHLETELADTKNELSKQVNLSEARRVKSASDIAAWEKQKRWQQAAEKMKTKLGEREAELERLKVNQSNAKNTIARLEREKHVLENRIRSSQHCHSASCPHPHGGSKYTPAESPESFVTDNTDTDLLSVTVAPKSARLNMLENNHELINALKARIESQQRKLVAMELDGKGQSATVSEFEKIQEKLSSEEAKNLRLEAKNLQLQLEIDMGKQTNDTERLMKQIKHLEDYVLVLKNEISQLLAANVRAESPAKLIGDQSKKSTLVTQMEQTILTLRRVVEKLKIENNLLRDQKGGMSATKLSIPQDIYIRFKSEYDKLQKSYSQSLDKISALQVEIELQQSICVRCREKFNEHNGKEINLPSAEMVELKEKMAQKARLLEKAKVLLTRAAAKEKSLRDQITIWKRRCSELQNVPVIDEISE